MSLDKSIDPKGRFEEQVASGLTAVGLASKIPDLVREINRNDGRAAAFFRANVFGWIATKDANIARAITCIQTIRGVIAEADIKDVHEKIVKRYNSAEKEQVKDQLRSLLGPGSDAAVPTLANMPRLNLPALQVSAGAVPSPVILPPRQEAHLKAIMAAANKRSDRLAEQTMTITTAMSSSAHDVLLVFNTLMISNTRGFNDVLRQVDAAYKHFCKGYAAAANDQNAKIELIAMIAKAGLGQIPVVGAVVGAVAGAAISKFKHTVEIPDSGPKVSDNDVSNMSGVSKLMHRIDKKVKEVTTLGVNVQALTSSVTLETLLGDAVTKAEQHASDQMKADLNRYFAEGESLSVKRERAVEKLFSARRTGVPGAGFREVGDTLDKDKAVIIQGLTSCFGRIGFPASGSIPTEELEFRDYVELSLWASYVRQLVGADKFDNGFDAVKDVRLSLPDAVFERLRVLRIVWRKGNMSYSNVIANGRLPYDGNPVHDLGVILFFQWYYSVNPFQIIGNNDLNLEKLKIAVAGSIGTIGKAIESSKSRSFFSRNSSIGKGDAVRDAQKELSAKKIV